MKQPKPKRGRKPFSDPKQKKMPVVIQVPIWKVERIGLEKLNDFNKESGNVMNSELRQIFSIKL